MRIPDRNVILFSLVACLLILCGVLVWSSVYDRVAFFPAGVPPKIEEPAPPPATLPPIRPSDPSRGGPPGKAVQIVEFADYSCLYCRLMEFEMKKVLNDMPDGVRLVWRDLPIPNERPDGIMAAVAGRCAADQGKFWEMHDALFESTKLDVASMRKIAGDLRMNESAFDTCLTAGKHMTNVQADIALAQQFNISGAPTLFIGREVLSGSYTADEIKAAVRRAQILKP